MTAGNASMYGNHIPIRNAKPPNPKSSSRRPHSSVVGHCVDVDNQPDQPAPKQLGHSGNSRSTENGDSVTSFASHDTPDRSFFLLTRSLGPQTIDNSSRLLQESASSHLRSASELPVFAALLIGVRHHAGRERLDRPAPGAPERSHRMAARRRGPCHVHGSGWWSFFLSFAVIFGRGFFGNLEWSWSESLFRAGE